MYCAPMVNSGSCGGGFWYLRALVAQKWRVHAHEEAELFVSTQLRGFRSSCKGITPITTTIAAIEQTAGAHDLRSHARHV